MSVWVMLVVIVLDKRSKKIIYTYVDFICNNLLEKKLF